LSRDADLGCCGRPTDAGIEPPAGVTLLRVDRISGDPLMWLETKGNCNLTGFSSTEGADKVVEQNFRVDVSQVSLDQDSFFLKSESHLTSVRKTAGF